MLVLSSHTKLCYFRSSWVPLSLSSPRIPEKSNRWTCKGCFMLPDMGCQFIILIMSMWIMFPTCHRAQSWWTHSDIFHLSTASQLISMLWSFVLGPEACISLLWLLSLPPGLAEHEEKTEELCRLANKLLHFYTEMYSKDVSFNSGKKPPKSKPQ